MAFLRWLGPVALPLLALVFWAAAGLAISDHLLGLVGAVGFRTALWLTAMAYLLALLFVRILWQVFPPDRRVAAVGSPPASGVAAGMVSKDRLLQVARHEAAHAVASEVLPFMALDSVSIFGGGHGKALSHSEPGADTQDWMWSALVMALAGNTTDLDSGFHHEGSREDWLAVWQYASSLASIRRIPQHSGLTIEDLTDMRTVLDKARTQAGALLAEHGGWIDRVATRLVEDRQMFRGDVVKLRIDDPEALPDPPVNLREVSR